MRARLSLALATVSALSLVFACGGGSSNPEPGGTASGGVDSATGGSKNPGVGGSSDESGGAGGKASGDGGSASGGASGGAGGCQADCECPEELGCAENAVCRPNATSCGCPEGYTGGTTLCVLDHDVDCKLQGLALSYLIEEGEQPGTKISRAQAIERVALIADLTDSVRTYGCRGDKEIVTVAKEMGLKVSAAAFMNDDDDQNAAEIACLIETCNAGLCDAAIVGNEFELTGASPEQIVEGIKEVKAAIPKGIPVTTAVIMGSYAAEPTLAAAVDELYVHIYPSLARLPIEYSISYIDDAYKKVRAVAGDKPIVISETGWPTGGNLGASPWATNTPFTGPDAAAYLMDFVSWAESELRDEDSYFYFAAMDEPWKVAVEGNWADRWGIATAGVLKPGMAKTLGCERSNPSWGASRIPDANSGGNPAINVTTIPGLETTDPICGTTNYLVPADHHVFVYVHTGGSWWGTKSAGGSALVMPDGKWCSDYASPGTLDEDGDEIAVLLMEKSYAPQPVLGTADLPSELLEAAADYEIVKR